jgi:uncharacterized protein
MHSNDQQPNIEKLEDLLTYPCKIAVKAIGKNNTDFEKEVFGIVSKHTNKKLTEGSIKTKPSKNNKYLAITITVEAQSKQQMDKIYQDLSNSKLVVMAL